MIIQKNMGLLNSSNAFIVKIQFPRWRLHASRTDSAKFYKFALRSFPQNILLHLTIATFGNDWSAPIASYVPSVVPTRVRVPSPPSMLSSIYWIVWCGKDEITIEAGIAPFKKLSAMSFEKILLQHKRYFVLKNGPIPASFCLFFVLFS